jgi:hypothetical protein
LVLSGEHPGELSDPLVQRVDDLRANLQEANPATLAARTRSEYHPAGDGSGKLRLSVWGQEVYVTFPDFIAYDAGTDEQLPTFTQALLAYYFHVSDGTAPSKSWIAFSEMPDGAFYAQAFQGYTGRELAGIFGNDVQAFERAAERLGGQREFFGNMAYSFVALPCVSLMVVCWLGDEDFPPSYRVLFDASASHHLTTDGCAIVGSTLTRKLIKAKLDEEKRK